MCVPLEDTSQESVLGFYYMSPEGEIQVSVLMTVSLPTVSLLSRFPEPVLPDF